MVSKGATKVSPRMMFVRIPALASFLAAMLSTVGSSSGTGTVGRIGFSEEEGVGSAGALVGSGTGVGTVDGDGVRVGGGSGV